MTIAEIKNIIEKDDKVVFELFSINYIIEKKNEKYVIYAQLYPNKVNEYNSFNELINEFKIYGETIKELHSKIKSNDYQK